MSNLVVHGFAKLIVKMSKKRLQNAELMDGSGRFTKPFHPECKTVQLKVIATALARIKRFFAQTDLSVAQHCVNMAKIFHFLGRDDLAKQALFHEIGEVFMGDLASPLKRVFPVFKEIEEYLIKKVFGCLGLVYPMSETIKSLDKAIMINEAVVNMKRKRYWMGLGAHVDFKLLEQAGVELIPWSQERSAQEFMDMALMLFADSGLHMICNEEYVVDPSDEILLPLEEYQTWKM